MLIKEMEKIKDPAMLLAIVNSVGLVGTTAYFYKQLESIRADMVKFSQTLTGVLRKLSEIEKGDQHKNEALHTLNDQVKRINEQIEDLPTFDAMDNMDMDLSELVAVLEENNIQVDRPSQEKVKSKRGGRHKRKNSDFEDRRRVPRSRDFDSRSSRLSSRDSTRDSSRDHRVQLSRTEPAMSYEDDADLIGEVRRQQTRN